MENINFKERTLSSADVEAITDSLIHSDMPKILALELAERIGFNLEENDAINSIAARRLLGNVSRTTLQRYIQMCPELKIGAQAYSRKRINEFRRMRQLGLFRKQKVNPVGEAK